MGVLNVTPDSFSDGGRSSAPAAAARMRERMIEEGAAIIDIGGESTRPGAAPVAVEEELRRVVPVIEALRRRAAVLFRRYQQARGHARGGRGRARVSSMTCGRCADPGALEAALRERLRGVSDAHAGRAAHHAAGARATMTS